MCQMVPLRVALEYRDLVGGEHDGVGAINEELGVNLFVALQVRLMREVGAPAHQVLKADRLRIALDEHEVLADQESREVAVYLSFSAKPRCDEVALRGQ